MWLKTGATGVPLWGSLESDKVFRGSECKLFTHDSAPRS